MSEDLLLTELCMVCRAKPYNGLRNPAAYIKRSDLATPKGIDHDYNYLTSIERQIDTAERDCESRGILLFNDNRNDAGKKRHQAAKGEVALESAIKQRRVVVDKAPKGISRQKQNATRWDKKAKRIIWTVEWVHKNGNREIGQFPESETTESSYVKLTTTKAKNEVAEEEHPRKKHKPNDEASRPPTLSAKPVLKDLPANTTVSPTSHAPPAQAPETTGQPAEARDQQNQETYPSRGPSNHQPSLPPTNDNKASQPLLNFYLLLPSTPTSYRVLIPLSPGDTLTTALTDRLVLEFPTIYALKHPPDKLPTGFMTEEEYLRGLAEKGNVNRHLDGLLGGAGDWDTGHMEKNGERDLDEGALRDVLKKDLVQEVVGQ
ncbi:MAG: hypothetical protein Q9207_004398 [Kuettlingeria erythrocarpa]